MRSLFSPMGIAFVKFSKRTSLNKALKLNGTEHLGMALTIKESREIIQGIENEGFGGLKEQTPIEIYASIKTPTLFIGGLSLKSTSDSIKEYFS